MPMTQVGKTPNWAVDRLVQNTTGQDVKANDGLTSLSVGVQLIIQSRTTSTAPGSPAEGDCYIVPSGGTGWASGSVADDLNFWSNGWQRLTPHSGWRGRVLDENIWVRYDTTGTDAWYENCEVGSVQGSITASTTQSQGQGALTKVYNIVTTVANANDVVTLPPARTGLPCYVVNRGANTLQIFPASGTAIDGGSTNASTTLATGKMRFFLAGGGANWYSITSA